MSQHYPFSLEPLPYATDALAPNIDARTLEFHHGKHLSLIHIFMGCMLCLSGLDEADLQNDFCVATYIACLQRFGRLETALHAR